MSPLWLVLILLPVIGSGERFSCRGRILGAYYADAKSGCKAFHVCVRVAGGGVRDFRFFCPPGTLFHQEAQTCTDWGDDDPLACPADIYDGQFDLYKIGSGFDTKKLSYNNNREEENEFGLQRAETGDRRSTQNVSPAPSGPASDLRAAHSSDFFSGQRDRGRDELAPAPAPHQKHNAHSRQSFRRTAPRATPTTPAAPSTAPSSLPPVTSTPSHYDVSPKRKFIRKRPIYKTPSTSAPSTFTENYPPRQRQSFTDQPQQNFERDQQQQNFVRRPTDNRHKQQTSNPPTQYNEEYVEVSRVTPKVQRFYSTAAPTVSFTQQQPSTQHFTKKDGLTELYNYEAQSTAAFNGQNENRPFKTTLRNSFSVSPIVTRDSDYDKPHKNIEINFNGDRRTSSASEYNNAPRNFGSSTPTYRNQNSVSYETEKNNFIPFAGAKQNYANTATQPPTTTTYTTTHIDTPLNLNTIAYKTNIGFDARPGNYANSEEDDGQYRPPAGEDDGQYRPEIYERELLSGAHSLNIAASGNRLPDDQKPRVKPHVKSTSQTAAPRPFTPPAPPSQPPRTPEPTYTTTLRPQTFSTQRVFDFFQPYTTTSRPTDVTVQNTPNFVSSSPVTSRATITTFRPNPPEPRPFSTRTPTHAPTAAPTPARPPHRPPAFSQPANKKEDNSYDYAYYDSDPGFTEYEHIEEFGKTKSKV